jgi:hypothetical protein
MVNPPELPLVFSRRQAVQLGFTNHAIDWRIAKGQWHVLRRAVFCRAEAFAVATPEQRHILSALALAVSISAGEATSHLSAALCYGWPAPIEVDPIPWTTIEPGEGARTRRRQGRVRQVAPLPGHHWRGVSGLDLTSAARTAADCLRHLPAEESVPIADGALAAGVDGATIGSILRWQSDWPYAARGLASARLLDGRRETWLESRSAVAFHRLGVPIPEPQVAIFDERGNFVARVDYLWADLGVVGEADGWGKYGRPVASSPDAPSDPMQALRDEKLREDRLRDLGLEMVRWTSGDLSHPERGLSQRLSRAFARARPDRLRGVRRPAPSPAVRDLVPATGLIRLRELSTHGVLIVPPASRCSRPPGEMSA